MIITVQYRDIPWEEAKKCQRSTGPNAHVTWEQEQRGKPVSIIVPGRERMNPNIVCHGPIYERADRRFSVCPHIAEIGD